MSFKRDKMNICKEKGYEPVRCEKCGFIMCGSLLEGGGAIADTGDYNDPSCPICGSHHIDDYEGEYVDQSDFLFNKLKAMDANWQNIYWKKDGELLDLQSKYRWWILDKHVRPQKATEHDNVAYLTLPHYKVMPWFDDSFWRWEESEQDLIRVGDSNITHWCRLPELPIEYTKK